MTGGTPTSSITFTVDDEETIIVHLGLVTNAQQEVDWSQAWRRGGGLGVVSDSTVSGVNKVLHPQRNEGFFVHICFGMHLPRVLAAIRQESVC